MAYVLSKKGKAKSNVTYNPEDGADSYSNPIAYQRIREYAEMAKEVHCPDYDPTTEEIDGEVLMRVEGGKKHGRYYIVDSAIDPTTTPTLSEIRARSTDTSPAIRPRVRSSQLQFQQLEEESRAMKEQLLEERRQLAELEARSSAFFNYMQTYTQQQGGPQPPPEIMIPPRPPQPGDVFDTPNASTGTSNNAWDSPNTGNPSPSQAGPSPWGSWGPAR